MRRCVVAFLIALTAASALFAQKVPATPAPNPSPSDADSRETREKLAALLHRYPPELGTVLKLDPTLFTNPAYLENYPALAAFVGQHPEVAHNPGFYLESVWIPGQREPETPTVRMWRATMGDLGAFSVFLVVTGVLAWVIKTLIEQRRWSRLSRVQTEVQNKLLDRFTSNEDLLAFIQSPAGKRFLESTPILLEAGPRPISAPIGRILWSIQVGLVLAAAGVGLLFVSGRVPNEVAPVLFAMGVVAGSVGAGFVLSAIVSFALSRRLGLWEQPAVPADRESQSVS